MTVCSKLGALLSCGCTPVPRKNLEQSGHLLSFVRSELHPGNLIDLFVFSPYTCIWTNLTRLMVGSVPSPRKFHGFASAAGLLFVFGGLNDDTGDNPFPSF